MADRAHLECLHREMLAEGRLIEAGWIGLRLAAVPHDAPKLQIDLMRQAFFAGAQHLFASLMLVFDPEEEPTADDVDRMEQIDAELKAFIQDFEFRNLPTQGEG